MRRVSMFVIPSRVEEPLIVSLRTVRDVSTPLDMTKGVIEE